MSLENGERKLIMLSVRMAVSTILLVFLYPMALDIAFSLSLGQDPAIDLGDNYVLQGPSGSIFYFDTRDDFKWEKVIPDETVKFVLKEPWLVGGTRKGWYAINKKTHAVYYPYAYIDQLEDITGLDSSTLILTTVEWPNLKKYLINRPGTAKTVLVTKIICTLLVLLFIFGPYYGPYLKKPKRVRS